jgi:hypothetical protein
LSTVARRESGGVLVTSYISPKRWTKTHHVNPSGTAASSRSRPARAGSKLQSLHQDGPGTRYRPRYPYHLAAPSDFYDSRPCVDIKARTWSSNLRLGRVKHRPLSPIRDPRQQAVFQRLIDRSTDAGQAGFRRAPHQSPAGLRGEGGGRTFLRTMQALRSEPCPHVERPRDPDHFAARVGPLVRRLARQAPRWRPGVETILGHYITSVASTCSPCSPHATTGEHATPSKPGARPRSFLRVPGSAVNCRPLTATSRYILV